MSFLPFVLSFLLILVLGSSLLFQSFRTTVLEKTIILSKNQALLNLRSEQARKEFKALQTQRRVDEKAPPIQQQMHVQKDYKTKEYIQKRALRRNIDASKFNLWPLIYEPDSVASKALYKKAINLIELLYGDADFFKTSTHPKLATALVDALLGQKKGKFSELFPQNAELSKIFYKMLRGTNTGYPRFEEFFKIEDCQNKPPICFSFASIPVLKSILGEKITNQILEHEKKKWETQPKNRVLTKEELEKLVQQNQTEALGPMNVDEIFTFIKPAKSLPKAYVDDKNKVAYIE